MISRLASLALLPMLLATAPQAVAAAPTPPPAAPAPKTPDDDEIPTGIAERITKAESAFRVQNYPKVVSYLDSLVGHPKLEGRPEHVKVLEWLGAAHWYTGAKDASRLVFGQLLKESPFHKLDPFVYPDQLIAFFETRRKELIDANVIPGKPGPDVDPNAPRDVLIRTVMHHDAPVIAYFVPFGVGQFANDDDGKGVAFAVIEGIGLVTMAAAWFRIEALKVDGTNTITEANRGEAELLDTLWLVGAGVFVASFTSSVVDGLINRRTAPTVEERHQLMRPSELPAAPPPRVILGPGPGDLGVGATVTF